MATYFGSRGNIEVFDDFMGFDSDKTWATGGFNVGKFHVWSVNEGSIEETVDETGGVVAFTLDTGDDDNVAITTGKLCPADGNMAIEARIKVDNVTDVAMFVGFSETLAKATPVMPAEFATATMTYNGTGGMIGLQWDSDGTTDDWRAVCGDGGAAAGGSGNGTRANSAAVADEWDVVRVELDNSGGGRVYLNGVLVKTYAAGSLTAADLFHPLVMCENRAASAAVFEVDYILVTGSRDWAE